MQPFLLALLPLIGAAIGASLQFVFGRNLEARKQLAVQRAQAYADFVKGLAQTASSAENRSLIADAKTRIYLYGSETVIQKLAKLYAVGATFETEVGRAAMLELLHSMRADVFRKAGRVSADDLERVLFYGKRP
jgi:TctA family transporter